MHCRAIVRRRVVGTLSMAGIFISYRREDADAWAGRIYERLAQDFQRNHIFMDVDNIAPGLDFVKELDRQVAQCDVLIAIIGKDWTDARSGDGQRRLSDPHDFVRIEIESALARDVRVIPVLVGGAKMPTKDELPSPLRTLTYRNAVELSHARFGSDVQRLVSTLKPNAELWPRNPATQGFAERGQGVRPTKPQSLFDKAGNAARWISAVWLSIVSPVVLLGSINEKEPQGIVSGVVLMGLTILMWYLVKNPRKK